MATTEERLAALEAKMAQLTATRPTTYYTHQYSGEEIDAATGRALAGGALDTSVTNVSNQLGTFVRPNLLDNWYFGRPVDQRGGYIVPKGVNYYKVDGFVPQGPIPETVRVDHIDYAGSAIFNYGDVLCYVHKDGGYVRGYTGNWIFTVDRWSLSGPSSSRVLTIRDGAIHLQGGTLPDDYIFQRVPYVPVGEYCFSVLFRGNTGRIALSNKLTDMSLVTAAVTSANAGLLTLHYKLDSQLSDGDNFFRINFDGECDIIAAKLELGPTQTLAHQDAAGNWVLNEVPEYGEQLRRCQRYAIKIGKDTAGDSTLVGFALCTSSTLASAFISLPVSMRTKPSVTFKNVYLSLGDSVIAVTNIMAYENTQNGIYCALSVSGGLTVGQTVAIRTSDGGYIMPSADL